MASDAQTGFGSRLENSKFLISVIKSYSQYSPILPLIKLPAYEVYVTAVETQINPYYAAKESFDLLDNEVEAEFDKIVSITRSIRNVIIELFGKDSGKYKDYNEIFDKITGDNISKNSYKRSKESDGSSTEAEFQSVAQVDRGSRLSNFSLLIEMLNAEELYTPTKNELKLDALINLRNEASEKNLNLATAYGVYTSERAKILPLFDGPEGLTVRAERSKAHVRSVYGAESPELKALTGKTY